MTVGSIITHPGGAHKDEFLACCILAATHGCPIIRREPTQSDLDDPTIAVVDVGGEHDPARSNFDHHQFPIDHEPLCALSLVLQDLGCYGDARQFCDWLETTERMDVTGPRSTAAWLGITPETLARLNSPIDITLLRRFATCTELRPGDPLYQVMSWIGEDLLDYLRSLRERLDYIALHAELWEVNDLKILFLPRTDPLHDDPSAGLGRHLEVIGIADEVSGLVYPDRRGKGYGLSRFRDDPRLDFTRIGGEDDVHFAHARGFVAKSSASDVERLRALLALAQVG
jgi:hypothetical protein